MVHQTLSLGWPLLLQQLVSGALPPPQEHHNWHLLETTTVVNDKPRPKPRQLSSLITLPFSFTSYCSLSQQANRNDADMLSFFLSFFRLVSRCSGHVVLVPLDCKRRRQKRLAKANKAALVFSSNATTFRLIKNSFFFLFIADHHHHYHSLFIAKFRERSSCTLVVGTQKGFLLFQNDDEIIKQHTLRYLGDKFLLFSGFCCFSCCSHYNGHQQQQHHEHLNWKVRTSLIT